MILACRWAPKPSIMAEKPRFRWQTVFAKNLGFGVGFGYRNNTNANIWKWERTIQQAGGEGPPRSQLYPGVLPGEGLLSLMSRMPRPTSTSSHALSTTVCHPAGNDHPLNLIRLGWLVFNTQNSHVTSATSQSWPLIGHRVSIHYHNPNWSLHLAHEPR